MSTAASLGKMFVRVRAPYVLVPRGGKKIAARIARDFCEVISGFSERYGELHGVKLDSSQGLTELLNSNVSPEVLFSQYRAIAEQSRSLLDAGGWSQEKGFDQGWRWLTDEFADWFVVTILPRPYRIDRWHSFPGAPLLTKVLLENPRGKQFMRDFVRELRKFLWPSAPLAVATSGTGSLN